MAFAKCDNLYLRSGETRRNCSPERAGVWDRGGSVSMVRD